MPNARKKWPWAVGILLAIALVWGLEQIVLAPLQTGEAYPAYSTLRTDPVGAKALYESLAALPELHVERLYKDRLTTNPGRETAIFVLGVDPGAWSEIGEKTFKEYETLTSHGARLVIAFLPVVKPHGDVQNLKAQLHLDIRFHYRDLAKKASDDDDDTIPGQTALYFTTGAEWSTIAEDEGRITAAERPLGKGTLVLMADSYLLSNEGLREDRYAAVVADLVGPARHIFFDENHFGVVETGSVTKLMRKYHLEGAVAVLALIAALFLWRSASSLLPPRGVRTEEAVTGRDSLEGMTALLRRGIAEKDLMQVCYTEWKKSARGKEIALAEGKDVAAAYRAASYVLTKRT